jgi:hypothetical protein
MDSGRVFELLTIDAIQQHVGPVVDELLGPRGFVCQKPLCWLRSNDAPVRQMFRYGQKKGGVLTPEWGYSLDFVPHLSGGKLKWHRTEKSALFDLFIDDQSPELLLYYIWGTAGLLEQMPGKIVKAVALAAAFWGTGHAPSQMPSVIDEARLKPMSGIYTQLPLAAALCFARIGRKEEGHRELEAFFERHNVSPETEAKLWHIFNEALDRAVEESQVSVLSFDASPNPKEIERY